MDRTLADLLEREHRDIDGGLEAFVSGVGETQRLTAAVEALKRHIYLEEVMVFPSLREGGLVAPVFVMLREHGEMWGIVEQLEAAMLSGADRASMVELCEQLNVLLESHNLKEEQVLYPRTDAMLPPGLANELKKFMATGQTPEGWRSAQAPSR